MRSLLASTASSAARLLTIACALIALIACSERRSVSYTFTKPNMTQQALLDDEVRLRKTSGVTSVMAKLDDKNTALVEIAFDEDDKAEGMKYVLGMGYSAVRN